MQGYILNQDIQVLPIGAVGELYIGGDGLARGYLNRPDLTAEKFVPNPFIKEEDLLQAKNLRLYCTGDLARYLPDGNIEFIGRSDDQVKIRGFRIELGEIEANLLQHPDVNQTVVIAREDQPDLKQLVAYIVPKAGILDSLNQETVLLSSDQQSFTVLKGDKISALTEDLRNHLARVLPDYMVPSFFVFIDKIPLNPNGKIDRKSLPAPEVTNIDGYVAPRNELETKICQAWSELLGIPEDKIGIHDDFFKLGGNSLLAIRLSSKLSKYLGEKISVAVIFKNRTVNELHNFFQDIANKYQKGDEYEF
jgi:acyl-CoA synthetase (AMP-forming)/AMP-acid ligase II/acyl carrier protein